VGLWCEVCGGGIVVVGFLFMWGGGVRISKENCMRTKIIRAGGFGSGYCLTKQGGKRTARGRKHPKKEKKPAAVAGKRRIWQGREHHEEKRTEKEGKKKISRLLEANSRRQEDRKRVSRKGGR